MYIHLYIYDSDIYICKHIHICMHMYYTYNTYMVYHLQHMTALDQHRAIEEHQRNSWMLRGATVGVHTHSLSRCHSLSLSLSLSHHTHTHTCTSILVMLYTRESTDGICIHERDAHTLRHMEHPHVSTRAIASAREHASSRAHVRMLRMSQRMPYVAACASS